MQSEIVRVFIQNRAASWRLTIPLHIHNSTSVDMPSSLENFKIGYTRCFFWCDGADKAKEIGSK